MRLEPLIRTAGTRLLVGIRGEMSLGADRTRELWQTLMPRRFEIENRVPDLYISMRVHTSFGPEMFAPETVFEKWAAVEVTDCAVPPAGMETHELSAGRYAVFEHVGPASTFPDTMRYIFAEWLPTSGFELDTREQFEELAEGWDPMDPQGREMVWIPIR